MRKYLGEATSSPKLELYPALKPEKLTGGAFNVSNLSPIATYRLIAPGIGEIGRGGIPVGGIGLGGITAGGSGLGAIPAGGIGLGGIPAGGSGLGAIPAGGSGLGGIPAGGRSYRSLLFRSYLLSQSYPLSQS